MNEMNIRSLKPDGFMGVKTLVTAAITFIGIATHSSSIAATIETSNPNLSISWDNTIKYSASWRLKDADPRVADNSLGIQANTNDGDLNFDKGLVSNRVDIFSELDVKYKRKYGFRLSAAARYDDVYNKSNDNEGFFGGALVNSISVNYDEFTDDTQRLHGKDIELLDAFAYGNFVVSDMYLNVKLGRFTQLYGESLFFGSNGVASAQTSLDLAKALSIPNAEFKDAVRPIGQVSAQLRINSQVSLGAYYQLEWRESRLPAAGSYFSFGDFAGDGGESLILAPGLGVVRGEDIEPDDQGQFGIQLKIQNEDTDYGLYVARFHDKAPQFYVRPGVNPVSSNLVGDYVQVYGENILMAGLSVSTLLGSANVAAEWSFRDNMPLVSRGITVIMPGGFNADGNFADGDDNAAFPVGKTMHLNLSVLNVFSENALWEGATLVGEFAFNRRLSIDENAIQLDPLATRDASALQFVFTPEYFQVMPGLDLQVPIGVAYGITGRSSVNGVLFPSEHGGNISLGIKADYKRLWKFALNYTQYTGSAGSVIKYDTAAPELSYKNFHGDRDFVSLSVQRAF